MNIRIPLLLFSCFLLIGCSPKEEPIQSGNDDSTFVIPEATVLKSTLQYNSEVSLWTLDDLPYSGFAASYYPDSTLKEQFGILNGKKQNKSIQWFPDGYLKNMTNYHLGKMHGEKKLWSADSAHVLIAQYNFEKGKAHGEQRKWYVTGELYKILHLNMGREEGMQQAYRKNGVVYANYEAREGRIFGLKKSALCYGLEDENLKSEK